MRAPFSGSESADPRAFPIRGVQIRVGAHVPGRGAAACFSEACVLNRRPRAATLAHRILPLSGIRCVLRTPKPAAANDDLRSAANLMLFPAVHKGITR